MKKAITLYCFDRILKSKEIDLHGCVKKAAEMGFDAIEFTDIIPPEGYTEAEYAEKLRETAAKENISISGYSVYADFINGSKGDLDAEIARIMRKVDVAGILGAETLRHDITSGFKRGERDMRGYNNMLGRFVEACRSITAYAASKKIRTCTENHGFFSQDSQRVEMLVNAVSDRNFGVQIDVGNFLCADEDPSFAVGHLAPYAFNVHLKDFIVKKDPAIDPGEGFFLSRGGAYLLGTVLGHGEVPLAQCVRALKREGYDGCLTLEFEGKEDLFYALEAGSRYIDRLIK